MNSIIKHFGMTAAILLSFLPASAYDFEVDGMYYSVVSFSEMTCAVTHGDKEYSGDIVVPAQIQYNNRTLDVTEIGSSAFKGCSSLQSIVIPNSVTKIGRHAFYGCSSLQSIVLPNSLTYIWDSAFEECSSLQSMVIPNSVTYIGSLAFSGCSQLKKIDLSNNLEDIAYGTFNGCKSLASLTIPGSVSTIELGRREEEFTFGKCDALKHIIFEYNSSSLEFGSFNSNKNEFRHIYDSLTSKLEYLCIDRQLNEEMRVDSIRELTIGKHLTELQIDFSRTSELTKIISHAQIPPRGISCSRDQYMNLEVKVPKGTLDSYKKAEEWKNFWNMEEHSDVPVDSIELNEGYVELPIDGTFQLEATGMPEDATDKTMVWSSSSPDVASVAEDGLVTAKAIGSAIITATCGDVSAHCVIEVKENSNIEEVAWKSDSQFDVYNLQGVRIKSSCSMDEIWNLPSGIYIVSGKKRRFKIKI